MIIARLRAFRIRSRMGDDLGRYKEVSEAELKAFEEDLIDILNQAVDEDIGIILLLPAMWVNDATLRDFGTNFPFLHSEWIREARDVFPPVVRRLTADYGVPWVDLAAVVQGRESELMMDMFHFNDLGAQVIAEAVSNEVENWLGVRE
jgi:lysophospholipase L1-like esterase